MIKKNTLTPLLLAGIFVFMLGLSFAAVLSLIINQFFPSTMPIWLAITSISLSVFVGVIAGVVPSYRAAGLDPIDALRYE